MMKNTQLLAVLASVLLHLAVIVSLINFSQVNQSLQHRASIESPVISIALIQAIKESKLHETVIETAIEQHDLPVSSVVVDSAKITVPKKEEKTARKQVSKENNKVTVSKKVLEQQKKAEIETEKTSTQPQPLKSQNGELTPSQAAMGTMGKSVQGFSNTENSSQLSSYGGKLRREVESHKQYPR